MYCLLTAYMDESYGSRAFCVAGWLSVNRRWSIIENQWVRRVKHERRMCEKQGLPPISRYKASDMASCLGEYEGWDVTRQIRFSRKLIDILGRNKPYAIAVGAGYADFLSAFPNRKADKKWLIYRFCMMDCLVEIGNFMEHVCPKERVAIIYDRGPFSSAAQSAFDAIKNSNYKNAHYLATMAPMGWEECVPLQTADLIAFEGYKLVDRHITGKFDFRKSLQRIIGNKVGLTAKHIDLKGFQKIAELYGPNPLPSPGNPGITIKRGLLS